MRPTDMTVGDSFELEYNGYEFVITYSVQRGLYDGDGDMYYFEAQIKDTDVTGRADFHFWRSQTRVAKIAAKRAIKEYEDDSKSTPEKIKAALS